MAYLEGAIMTILTLLQKLLVQEKLRDYFLSAED